jgi:hypothetical protein
MMMRTGKYAGAAAKFRRAFRHENNYLAGARDNRPPPGAPIMRRFSALVSLTASLLAAACTTARTAPDPAPPPVPQPAAEPALDPAAAVSHPIDLHALVEEARWNEQQSAKEDSAIMQKIRGAVDFWNAGNLDRFVFELYGQSATWVGSGGPVEARTAVGPLHAARWFRGGRPSGTLSVRLERAWHLGSDVRLFVCRWSVTDAATGREESWTSSLSLRKISSWGWTVLHEHSSLAG